MPLYKSSQLIDAQDNIIEDLGDKDEVFIYEEKPTKDEVIELHQPDEKAHIELTFKLPPLPGSEAEEPLEVSTDDAIEVEDKTSEDKNDLRVEKEIEVSDPWGWQSRGPERILEWVGERMRGVPRHTGKEVSGIERAIAYLKKINSEMSKAISSDLDGKVDIQAFENARIEVLSGIDRLEKAKKLLEQGRNKKEAKANWELIKEAQKATHVGGIIITVPIFISRLAKICINGTVSAGHSIEDIYERLVKKYALDNVKQAELLELLANMGYPIRRDRAYDVNELMDTTSSDNFDWAASYNA